MIALRAKGLESLGVGQRISLRDGLLTQLWRQALATGHLFDLLICSCPSCRALAYPLLFSGALALGMVYNLYHYPHMGVNSFPLSVRFLSIEQQGSNEQAEAVTSGARRRRDWRGVLLRPLSQAAVSTGRSRACLCPLRRHPPRGQELGRQPQIPVDGWCFARSSLRAMNGLRAIFCIDLSCTLTVRSLELKRPRP